MKAQRWIELEMAFDRTEVIVVCWHPQCSMHRLNGWSEDDWEAYPRKTGYGCYSHGLCQRHYHEYERQVEDFFAAHPSDARPGTVTMLN